MALTSVTLIALTARIKPWMMSSSMRVGHGTATKKKKKGKAK